MKSIVSYPERGVGGNNHYRGNCSPRLIEDLIKQFKVSEICDYMAGSYTTQDVAGKIGIISHCYDLNHGFDLMNMDIPQRSEFTFWHPPYWNIVKYADGQYSAKEIIQKYGFDPRENDLSKVQAWEDFVKMQNYCMMKQYAALERGGRIAVLMGDIKKKGKLYSQLCEIVKPGTIENIVIKAQHNCTSDRMNYAGKFIPIVHEYLLIIRKDMPLTINYLVTEKQSIDMRDMQTSTWRDVLHEVLEEIGKAASLTEIYEKIEGHKKAQRNPHWKEKVRQTLYLHSDFQKKDRGIWKLVS